MVSILPSSLPCPRAERRPVTSVATGLFPASIFNPLDVSRDSMRVPLCGSGLERFFEKRTLPFGKFDTLFHFLNTSRARVLKMTHFRKILKSNCVLHCFFTLPKNSRFTLGVLQKSSPDHFNRVFPLFIACKNVPISLGGAHFFDRHRAISTRGSNENCFFAASVEK